MELQVQQTSQGGIPGGTWSPTCTQPELAAPLSEMQGTAAATQGPRGGQR